MEMPFSDICWLIEFIAPIWETLTSSLLTASLHSPVCANTRDKATGVSAEGNLLVQEEINLILPQITTSCPQFLQGLC